MDPSPPLTGLLDVAEAPPAPHPLVGALRVADTAVPEAPTGMPLSVTVTGGAGQVAGPAAYCRRVGLPLASIQVTLRDLDDPAGNARRVVAAVDAARAEGALAEDVPVYVAMPAVDPSYSWLAAADEVAAAELRLALDAGGVPAPVVASWLDAALDRETPFRAGGLGVVTLLAATLAAYDGGAPADVVTILRDPEPAAPAADDLPRARRWLASVACGRVDEALADLRAQGLAS